MTWADLATLLIVAISGLLALARGFVREVLGLAAWVGAAIAAAAFYPSVEPTIVGLIHDQKLGRPIAIGVVFIVVLIILSVIAAWIASLVHASVFSGLDRTLGLLFGLIRGGVVVCLIFIFLSMFLQPPEWPQAVTQGRFLPYVESGSAWLIGLVPKPYRPAAVSSGGVNVKARDNGGSSQSTMSKSPASPSSRSSSQ